jgi:adenylate cyclase
VNPLLRLTARERGGPSNGAATVSVPVGTTIELGRVDAAAKEPERMFAQVPIAGGVRLPIAPSNLSGVSRRQVQVEPLASGAVRITNLSSSIPLTCLGRPSIAPGLTVELPLPIDLQIGTVDVTLAVEGSAPPQAAASPYQPLETHVGKGDNVSALQKRTVSALLANVPPATIDSLVAWWQNVIAVLQSASNSNDFFQKAAQAVVRLVGLDVGGVFLVNDGAWRPAALETSGPRTARPSTTVLQRVLEAKQTFYSRVDQSADVFSSIASIDAYVAAPILNRDGNVIGAVYGHRSRELADAASAEITHLEALLVQTLASGVAAGLARMEHQEASLARKVQFEQFFSPELAAQLDAQPDLLAGRDADVTVLFCDIRGFSSVSERLGPTHTMDWIGGVLSTLSDQVAEAGGVLVDYIGDEMMAMWGAPSAQPDHAVRACRAAKLMLDHSAAIDARWQSTIGAPTLFGIGVNSAPARVGNTGSTRKFKYGPLGNGVNLASRVQGATKYLKVPAIVTGSTRRLLDDSFLTRRLCRVRVVNIVEPVDLYELDCGGQPITRERFAQYEEALAAFDAGSFSSAARTLGNLLGSWPGDGPSLVLLSRAVDCMIREPRDFSPVWELPGK